MCSTDGTTRYRFEFAEEGNDEGDGRPPQTCLDVCLGSEIRPIRLGGSSSALGNRAHICAFFSKTEDEYEMLASFYSRGFRIG